MGHSQEGGIMRPPPITYPFIRSLTELDLNQSRIGVRSLAHLLISAKKLSEEETMFIHLVMLVGIREAIELETTPLWKLQQSLQALRVALSEYGKSCNAQNAKRKRPSGSPASSRRRSSGA